ncbi:MAG: M28 family peptidase [Clostridia bacterium]|nr:M28 family peptidase [Clostridia bacterium]
MKKTSPELLKYMIDGIKFVCQKYKRRSPGSQSERDAQDYFKKELSEFADEVYSEDFTLHPHAFMGFIFYSAIFSLIGVACYWLSPVSSVLPVLGTVLTLLAVLMFLFEFLFYGEFVDFLFPKRVSRNVFATRKPSGEVKRRIIFGGHTDASPEWTFSLHGGLPALAAVIGGSIIGMFIIFGSNIAIFVKSLMSDAVVLEGFWKVLGIVNICTIPFIIAIMFFINWRVIVDGANDNLSANYISMAVMKEMAENDFRFENTEVCCLLSGSEEAGLRGAKAFAKKHRQEMLDVETVFISLDTMREIKEFRINTIGCTGTVHSDEAVGDLLHEAGMNCGVDIPRSELYPGAVDADGFTKYGLRACGFTGVSHDPQTYYHTREDSWDNISPECLELSLDICREAARLYDENGGIKKYDDARK